jgi:putative endonuclease
MASSQPRTTGVPSTRRGAAGEAAAERFLQERGWQTLGRNVVFRPGELDLVMRDPADGTVVFVEVKTRGPRPLVEPLAAVTPAKRRRLVHAAARWLAEHTPGDVPLRFDIVCVCTKGASVVSIEHLPGAFDAEGAL